MRISRIEAIPVCTPLHGYADAYEDYSSRGIQFVLVKIETDEGVTGFGEATSTPSLEFYGDSFEAVIASIRNYLAPKLLGEDPLNIRRITSIMNRTQLKSTIAKTGIDLALYDLAGKALGVPTCTLLGGMQRPRIRVASEVSLSGPDKMLEETQRILKMGFRTLKFKTGRNVDAEIQGIRAVREAVGPDIELSADANGGWSRHDALKAMKAFSDLNLRFMEQPLPGWDLEGHAWLRGKSDVPIMLDESVWTPQDVIKIERAKAADLLNIKIEKTGGLKNALELYATARAVGLSCMIGNECETGIALAAKLHLASAFEDLPLACEFTELPYATIVLKDSLKIEDGTLPVPTGPGMGVTLDMDLIEQYRVKT